MATETAERYWRHPDGLAVGMERTITETAADGSTVVHVEGTLPEGYDLIGKAAYDAEIAARDAFTTDVLAEALAADAEHVAAGRLALFDSLVADGMGEGAASLLSGHQV